MTRTSLFGIARALADGYEVTLRRDVDHPAGDVVVLELDQPDNPDHRIAYGIDLDALSAWPGGGGHLVDLIVEQTLDLVVDEAVRIIQGRADG